jgi:type I restriction enzyme M protein
LPQNPRIKIIKRIAPPSWPAEDSRLNCALLPLRIQYQDKFEWLGKALRSHRSESNLLFRGGAEERIRTKLLKDGHIDTVIGLPANLFYSTGIPVCILVLKKCKKPDDVLFINAAEHFVKGKRQNQLTEEHITKIINTYKNRNEESRYSRRVEMAEIEKNDFNLNISRYISTATADEEIDLQAVHATLLETQTQIIKATKTHNQFLQALGLPLLPD